MSSPIEHHSANEATIGLNLVIDDLVRTQRLWDMKNKEVKIFYMCEIRKDFTIDATFKGNASCFLNHSCDPNCKLEKCADAPIIITATSAAQAAAATIKQQKVVL
ncbi:histone-lysine N-methyltransferase ASHR3-like isoform X2 [Beta vulgaris subsp. vulgaris]|uniref:histone-lysine N-methyltransferase ASHR3-like isoform X2 n=1 Tax=Beta vulgaris subsp. vulgaris TaxID=3555 RepID=UPI00053FD3DE|nr:histone-lysine N-methyltransferase ASHR3-like isoform X2 [Beta vulgaris subsp. vulgaris]